MERSTKHGLRIDDEMSAETEALVRSGHEPRVEEHREMEPAGDDQHTPDVRLSGDPYPGAGLPTDTLELRADIARFLRPSIWPADRETLLATAREEDAPGPILELLDGLPWTEDRYENLAAVWMTLGGAVEDTRT